MEPAHEIAGRPETATGDVEWRAVSSQYFAALGSAIVRGRALTESDGRGDRRVVIVNEAFAREYFADGDAVGQRVAIGRYQGKWIAPQFEGEAAEIVGVVEDMREMALRREPKRTMIVPREQAAMVTTPVILARTSRPAEAAALIRQAVQEVDASLPAPAIRAMREVIGESLARDRFNALLMSMFAGLALLMTAAGIFGVVSYSVRRRRAEIGIRMALGARAVDVVRLVTRQGMMPVFAGLALGVVAALFLSRFLRSMVWGVSVTDPRTFALVIVVLAGVALTAAWIPARRAAGADPVRSLRQS